MRAPGRPPRRAGDSPRESVRPWKVNSSGLRPHRPARSEVRAARVPRTARRSDAVLRDRSLDTYSGPAIRKGGGARRRAPRASEGVLAGLESRTDPVT